MHSTEQQAARLIGQLPAKHQLGSKNIRLISKEITSNLPTVRPASVVTFTTGSGTVIFMVFNGMTQKLFCKWRTGFRVFEVHDSHHVKLIHENISKISKSLVNVARIKPAAPRPYTNEEPVLSSDIDASLIQPLQSKHPTTATDLNVLKSDPAQQTMSPIHCDISKIVAYTNKKGRTYYRVSYKGLTDLHNQWVPLESLPSPIKFVIQLAGRKIKFRKFKD